LSPVHLNGAGTALDHYFSGYLLRSDLKEWVGAALLGRSLLSPVISTSFVNAAAWLISAECLRRTGGFDPIFFHYGEDLNYSQRVLYHNFLIGIHMDTRICHDRELRLAGPVATAIQRKRDKIHFLNQACDIRHAGYWTLILRRSLRHSLLMLRNLFDKDKLAFNFYMAKTAVSHASSIGRSRRSAKGKLPFLSTGK
ncbi:MAG TPA: hypothetical protein VE035_01360, partial [Puia sp.]|nr:hypothetical protein [Puia sp.]